MVLKIGELLFLEYQPPNRGEVERFRTRILEFNDSELFIDLPINEKTGKTGFFSLGTSFKAWVLSNKVMFSFTTEFIRREKENVPMMVLSFSGNSEFERAQRRQYVRVTTLVDVAVHAVNREFFPFVTTSLDISGGGAAIVLPEGHPLQQGMIINAWFALPMQTKNYHYLTIKCEVIRLYKEKLRDKERASLKFINMKESDRVHVIRYCFEQEVQQRRKLQKK